MIRIFAVLFLVVFVLANPANAETVSEKLEQRKADFLAKADPKKIQDYEDGIELVASSGVLESAKQVGDHAPDFTLSNAAGEQIKLSTVLEQGPVVLIWYRGEWCPYCNIYLEDLHSHAEDFAALNATVIAISPETPDNSWSAEDKQDLQIQVLSDEGSYVAKAYGVSYVLPPKIATYLQEAFNIHEVNNDDSNTLPLSASYVIGQDGVITYAYLNADYRERAETAVLLDEVKTLQKEGGE